MGNGLIHNPEAERGIISAVLASPQDKPLDLLPEHFYNIDHQKNGNAGR
jgi:hypothetical protein